MPVVIQNTTFGGIQGFSRKPQTPWFDDNGTFAGIVHQERNWTFVLFKGAGHLVPQQQPDHVRLLTFAVLYPISSLDTNIYFYFSLQCKQAMIFLREFVLGNNKTGFFDNTTNTVQGGEETTLFVNNILPGQTSIFVGNRQTESAFVYPSATIAAWESFTQTAIPPGPTSGSGSGGSGSGGSGSSSSARREMGVGLVAGVLGVGLMMIAMV